MFTHPQRRDGSTHLLRSVVATLCILLILLVGAAHLLHTHAADDPAGAACSLCAVAHLSPLASPMTVNPVAAEVVQVFGPPEILFPPARFLALNHTIRPPPVLTTHA